MLRKSIRKLLALIVAVVIGLVLLRWLSEQSRVEASLEPVLTRLSLLA